MKGRKALPNIIGILLAIVIMAGGIAIPINLLNEQEQRIIGKSYNATADSYDLVSMLPPPRQTSPANEHSAETTTPAPTPRPLPTTGELISGMSVDELYVHLYAWSMNGISAYREPNSGELNMEQAVAYVKAVMQGIVDMGAFSADAWGSYHFIEAQLLSNTVPAAANETSLIIDGITVPVSMGRWIVSFENETDAGKITVNCDAITGTIYQLRIVDDMSLLQVPPDGLLNLLAAYFKLPDDGWSYTENQSPGSIMSERFELLFQTENSNSYTFSLNIKIDN
ncbi:MAG TPA: hypothetical protein VN512_06695 [Clostridia bacterium]|nr:hypothetical protein [Clostridia bacterium]